jgi:hypothetical protein
MSRLSVLFLVPVLLLASQTTRGQIAIAAPKGSSSVVDFPPDWTQRLNPCPNAPKWTKLDKAILVALDTPITLECEKTPIKEFIESLTTKTKVPMELEDAMLQAVGQPLDAPVTVACKKVPLRDALRQVLDGFGLTYVIEDERIKIVTPEIETNRLVIRSYDVADLAVLMGMKAEDVGSGEQRAKNVQELISKITTQLHARVWKTNGKGGKGTIVFYEKTSMLIIKQSAELHMILSGALRD